jgi:hypothetical protein
MFLTDLIKPEHIREAHHTPFTEEGCIARYQRLHDLIEALCKPVPGSDRAALATCIHLIDEAIEIATYSDSYKV